ncbi:LysR family transcriptional regulator [Enterocloster citroniae]
MELRVLKYFLTAVNENNITRAADILHITQPTLQPSADGIGTGAGDHSVYQRKAFIGSDR